MKLAALLLLLAQAAPPPQFKSGVNLVEVDIVVSDSTGAPVRGLRREDFDITEDGQPVELMAFTAVDLPAAAPTDIIPPLDRSGSSVGSNRQPDDGRVLLIVLDDLHVNFEAGRAATARTIASRMVERMGPADLGAVMATSGLTAARAEFTTDKARLLDAIDRFFPQSETIAGSVAAGRAGAGGQAFGFANEYLALRAMGALRDAASSLALIPSRRKAILLVSQGLPLSVEDIIAGRNAGGAFQALKDFILTAQRSNVAVYTMDPCGLDRSPGCSTDSRQNLASIAESTGGFPVTNTNAPENSVDRMIAETGTYYLIGYASPTPAYDGKRHRIKVRTRVPGHQIRARESYIAARGPSRPKPPPSRGDALIQAPIQARGLTMRVVAVPAPLAAKPGATVAVGIELLSADAVGAGSIDFTVVASSLDGDVRARQQFRSPFEPVGRQLAGWVRLGSRLDVAPGRYQLRLAAVGANGSSGSVFTEVTVPKFSGDLALGGLSLGTPSLQSEKVAGPIAAILPLVPLSAREFRTSAPLKAQLPIRIKPTSKNSIKIGSILIREGGGTLSLPGSAVDIALAGPAGAVYQVALPTNLDPGRYRLMVDVRFDDDRASRELAFTLVE